jgi:hypothetical protein
MISISSGRASFFLATDWLSQAEKFFRLGSQVPLCSGNQQKRSVTASPENSANTTENQITSLGRKRLVNAKNRRQTVAGAKAGAPTSTSPDSGWCPNLKACDLE